MTAKNNVSLPQYYIYQKLDPMCFLEKVQDATLVMKTRTRITFNFKSTECTI